MPHEDEKKGIAIIVAENKEDENASLVNLSLSDFPELQDVKEGALVRLMTKLVSKNKKATQLEIVGIKKVDVQTDDKEDKTATKIFKDE